MENEIDSSAKAEVTSDDIFARIDKHISKPTILGLTTLALLAHRDIMSPTKPEYMIHVPDDQVSNFSDTYLGCNRILMNDLVIIPSRPFDFIDPFLKEPNVKLVLPFLNSYEHLEDPFVVLEEKSTIYINTIGCKSFTKARKRKRRNANKSKKANRR